MSDSILPVDTDTCLVEFDKKEYAIVGDLFFAKTLEEVPPWFQELVQDTVVRVNGNTYDTLAQYNISLLAALQGIEVSKNTYEQYINKLITDQEAFVSVLTTLNSTINDNDATIRQLLLTYATEDFAVASAAQLLTASINGGAISALIGSVETAMATQYGAMAQRLQTLETEFTDVAGQQGANASAIQSLTTYTGYGVHNGADALIANSNFYSNLNAYLDGTDYSIGGSSTLLQDVTAVSTEKMKQVEAKFEYGSTIELDGKQYNAGFGLVQTGTLLPDGTTYDSEFWIRASKFKFIADDGVTVSTPFQIQYGTVYIGWDSVAGSTKPEDGATRNVNRGAWYSGTAYIVGDVVQYNGSSYTNKLATSSANPTNTSYWTLLASQGPSGPVGVTGPQGPTGSRGASTANKTVTTALSSYTAYDSDFAAVTGFSDRIKGDTLIVTSSHSTDGGTKTWVRNATGSTSWTNYALAVNGNALITGTVAAAALAADAIIGKKVEFNNDSSNLSSATFYDPQRNWTNPFLTSYSFKSTRSAGTGNGSVGLYVEHTGSGDGSGIWANCTSSSQTGAAVIGTNANSSSGSASWGGYFYNKGSNGLVGISDFAEYTGVHGRAKKTNGGYCNGYLGSNSKGLYTTDGAYINGTIYPFTGSHEGFLSKIENVQVGDILVDVDSVVKNDISDTVGIVSISVKAHDKAVVGVYKENVTSLNPKFYEIFDPSNPIGNLVDIFYADFLNNHYYVGFNSVGEGQVNVCGLGGNLEPGDLITSSTIPGKGMKQTDDLVRNYTVGKCREYVTFDYPEQIKQVACIYMCG